MIVLVVMTVCQMCGEIIQSVADACQAAGLLYHSSCFVCTSCGMSYHTSSLISIMHHATSAQHSATFCNAPRCNVTCSQMPGDGCDWLHVTAFVIGSALCENVNCVCSLVRHYGTPQNLRNGALHEKCATSFSKWRNFLQCLRRVALCVAGNWALCILYLLCLVTLCSLVAATASRQHLHSPTSCYQLLAGSTCTDTHTDTHIFSPNPPLV